MSYPLMFCLLDSELFFFWKWLCLSILAIDRFDIIRGTLG